MMLDSDPTTAMRRRNCQSCGMPLSRDKSGGGTESDGSKSLMYCGNCYQKGAFTLPDLTVGEMVGRVKGRMKEMGIPGFLAGLFTRRIPDLERWKKMIPVSENAADLDGSG